MENRPHVLVLSGPNGAGKSTAGPGLLRDVLGITEFVNADTIARGLSAFNPDGTAIQAGRIMLKQLNELSQKKISFAFETTLASRTFAPWLVKLKIFGYHCHIIFLWLPNASFALERVKERVKTGGHHVPEPVIQRRYTAGLKNFFKLYRPFMDTWRIYDSSDINGPQLIASYKKNSGIKIIKKDLWKKICEEYENG